MKNILIKKQIENVRSKKYHSIIKSQKFLEIISDELLTIEYVKKDKSSREVAKEFGVDSAYIQRRLNNLEILRNKSEGRKGKHSSQWKGDNVGLNALHTWIKLRKAKPKLCEECKIKKPYDLANISGEYKRDINDFEWLCRKCHMNEDGRLKLMVYKSKSRSRIKENKLSCAKCKKFKNKHEFSYCKTRKDGYNTYCRKCESIRRKNISK